MLPYGLSCAAEIDMCFIIIYISLGRGMQITYILWEPVGGEGGVIYMSIVMDIKTNTICHVCICMVVYEEV
jgi:hypothetical protein